MSSDWQKLGSRQGWLQDLTLLQISWCAYRQEPIIAGIQEVEQAG